MSKFEITCSGGMRPSLCLCFLCLFLCLRVGALRLRYDSGSCGRGEVNVVCIEDYNILKKVCYVQVQGADETQLIERWIMVVALCQVLEVFQLHYAESCCPVTESLNQPFQMQSKIRKISGIVNTYIIS
jgi:hypothetical protein